MTRSGKIVRRRIDAGSALLALAGAVCLVVSYLVVQSGGSNPLILVPSVVAITLGVRHLVVKEARDVVQD